MLRVTVSKNAVGALHYFTNALKKEDYFFAEKEVTANWAGKTAAHLGLTGKVAQRDFKALLNGINPSTGESFILRQIDNRRVGYEYCFNAPKSVSLAYATTKDPEILNAHRLAVRTAMAEIEADMQTKNKELGAINYETTGNIVYARFDHFTTRPIEEMDGDTRRYIPDPHLHSHCFTFNVTHSEQKNRLQSLEEGNIRQVINYYESIYHSLFSKTLADKGYPIVRTKDRWEIEGISRALIEKFSRRTLAIEALAKAKDITDVKKKSELGAKTRLRKNKSVEEYKLYQIWEQRLSKKELFHIRSIKGCGGAEPKTGVNPNKAIEQSLDHFLERKSAIPEKRVLGQALTLGYGQLLPGPIKKAFATRKDILSATLNTIKYITTKEAVAVENQLLQMAVDGKGTLHPLHPNYQIKQPILSEEQRKAVQTLLHAQDAVTLLHGGAGVGKTSLLTEVQQAVQEVGKQLFAIAPSANASRGVLRKKGFETANTITHLLQNKELQDQLKGNVAVVDEAGMVGSKTMLALMQLAKKQNARLILSGDHRQHSSVERGDALKLLQERAQLQTASVKKVIRQQNNEPYRKAIQDLAKGNTLSGFRQLDQMGAVIELPDQKEREQHLAKAYVASLQKSRTALVVAPTHAEGAAITKAIRAELKTNKIITGKEQSFETLRPISYTETKKRDKAQYEPGMHLRFHQKAKGVKGKGFKAAAIYKVVEDEKTKNYKIQSLEDGSTYPLPIKEAEKFEVYTQEHLAIAKGDKIQITHNGKTKEDSRIHNGQTYHVKGFTRQGHINLSNGKTLDKDFKHFRHGHVSTSYASQGKDAQDVFIAQSSQSLPASNEKQFYVSASRGKERCFIYTDDKTDLRKAIERSGDRMTAKEVADQHNQRISRNRQVQYYQQELNRANEKKISKQPQRHISREQRTIER